MDPGYDMAGESESNRRRFLEACRQQGLKSVSFIRAQNKDGFKVTSGKSLTVYNTDGLVTTRRGEALLLMPADCIPLVFYAAKPHALALVHIGRRGAQLQLHQSIINFLLEAYSLSPSALWAYMGPSIKQQSYIYKYIDPTIAKDKKLMRFVSDAPKGHRIDLRGLLRTDLIARGLRVEQISESTIDTFASAKFFSHRQAMAYGQADGRNGFAVWMK